MSGLRDRILITNDDCLGYADTRYKDHGHCTE